MIEVQKEWSTEYLFSKTFNQARNFLYGKEDFEVNVIVSRQGDRHYTHQTVVQMYYKLRL